MTEPSKENDSFSLEVGGPWPTKLKGILGLLVGFIMTLIVALVYMVNFSLGKWGEPFDIQERFAAHEQATQEKIREIHTLTGEMSYIMSVCLNQAREAQCQKLNLEMPDSLKRKQRQE